MPEELRGYLAATLLATAFVLAGTTSPQAAAARPARPAEAKAIIASTQAYVLNCCRIGRTAVTSIQISTVDTDFARAAISAPGGPHGTGVLVHTHSGRWTVIALRTARLACGISTTIRHDLHLPSCG